MNSEHTYCFACGTENPDGLALEFSYTEDEEITAVFRPQKRGFSQEFVLQKGMKKWKA